MPGYELISSLLLIKTTAANNSSYAIQYFAHFVNSALLCKLSKAQYCTAHSRAVVLHAESS